MTVIEITTETGHELVFEKPVAPYNSEPSTRRDFEELNDQICAMLLSIVEALRLIVPAADIRELIEEALDDLDLEPDEDMGTPPEVEPDPTDPTEPYEPPEDPFTDPLNPDGEPPVLPDVEAEETDGTVVITLPSDPDGDTEVERVPIDPDTGEIDPNVDPTVIPPGLDPRVFIDDDVPVPPILEVPEVAEPPGSDACDVTDNVLTICWPPPTPPDTGAWTRYDFNGDVYWGIARSDVENPTHASELVALVDGDTAGAARFTWRDDQGVRPWPQGKAIVINGTSFTIGSPSAGTALQFWVFNPSAAMGNDAAWTSVSGPLPYT